MLEAGGIFGGYRIERLLGQGGLGAVYEATELASGRRVAIKVLSPLPRKEDATRHRLLRELLVGLGLVHPHIVGVLAVGVVDGQPYIAMELVRGCDLGELIARRELDAGRALRLLGQVADALDAVHAAGVTHRAVKSSNVLVGPGDHAYLTDLGLMLEVGDVMTRTGELVGAVNYVAPERITGAATTAQADIYSLGVVLYEALTGDLPFRRDSVAAVLRAHVMEQPPRVTDVRPELPAALDAVVAAALAKDPRDRPTSAVMLLRDAERALGRDRPPRIAGSEQDAQLRELLSSAARAGVAVAHVAGSQRTDPLPTGGRDPQPAAPAEPPAAAPPDPPPVAPGRRPGAPSPQARLGSSPPEVDGDGREPMRGAALSARDPWWIYVIEYRRVVVCVLAALAGIAAALRWLPLFTLEIDLEDEDDELDTVDCTVFAAPAVAPGEALLIQVFAHLPLQADDVRALATEFDTAASRRAVRGLQTRVARGTTLTFRLDLPGARVDEGDQSILWQGRAAAVQFSAIVDPEAGAGSLIATVAVTQSGVPIGHVKFKLDVTAPSPLPDRAPAPVPVGHAASRYRSAFLSYASADRATVIRGAQLLRSVQIECFQDILDLDPGERWERRLYEAIEDSDLFLLFWSRAAKESTWVRREALHALRCKLGEDDPPEIKPIVLARESIEPWPELAHLHFRDALTHFIADADGS